MSKKDAINVGSIALGVASLFAGPGGALAAYASIIRGAQVAFTLYGMYDGYRQSQKAKGAIFSSLEDRTTTVTAVDEPKSVIYGRRIVRGSPVFIVEPQNFRPVNHPRYYFWMVYAFEPMHEIDEIEEIYFNGEPVGPYVNSITGSNGTDVAPGSKFYSQQQMLTYDQGTVGAGGRFNFTRTAISTMSITVTPPGYGQTPVSGDLGYDPMVGGPVNLDHPPIVSNGITVPAEYVGWNIKVDYMYDGGGPYVYLRGYRGTEDQTVDKRVQEAASEWNDNCRLRGNPYVVVRIDPDLEMFPSGAPVVSARIRGKRVLDPWTFQTAWSDNPALHIYDYMVNYCRVLPAEINLDLLLAVRNASNEAVLTGNYNGSPVYEPRFACNAILSSEQGRVDNLRILLAAIGGTMTYSAGRYDVRAAVQEAASGTLGEGQLGSGDISVQPRPSVFEGFNAVRGVFPDQTGKYLATDYPPYQSLFYLEQDNGVALPQQIDLAAVTSAHQAQRIARIQLHLARNALTFEATWNMSALAYSPGQVINVTMPGFGWDAKPFRILRREVQDDMQIKMMMREEPASIYSWNYQEGRDPDPAPNTNLPSPYDVAAITGLVIQSGPTFAEYEAGGQVKPSARATWNLHTTQGVLYGGNIELWWKWGEHDQWQKVMLAGTAIRHDMPVRYNKQLIVQVRGVLATQVGGPWAVQTHRADGAPTSAIAGSNLLANPIFSLGPDGLNRNLPGWQNHTAATGQDALNADQVLYYYDTAASGNTSGQGIRAGNYAFFGSVPVTSGRPFAVRSTEIALNSSVKRVVAYADVGVLNCRAAVAVRFLNNAHSQIADYRGEFVTDEVAEVTRSYARAFVFLDVPANATSAIFIVYAEVNNPAATDASAQVSFRMPYFGIASPNQQTLPDWTP